LVSGITFGAAQTPVPPIAYLAINRIRIGTGEQITVLLFIQGIALSATVGCRCGHVSIPVLVATAAFDRTLAPITPITGNAVDRVGHAWVEVTVLDFLHFTARLATVLGIHADVSGAVLHATIALG